MITDKLSTSVPSVVLKYRRRLTILCIFLSFFTYPRIVHSNSCMFQTMYNMYCMCICRTVMTELPSEESTQHVLCNKCILAESQCALLYLISENLTKLQHTTFIIQEHFIPTLLSCFNIFHILIKLIFSILPQSNNKWDMSEPRE